MSATQGGSLVDRIRARREALLADLHLDMPVPSWGGDLVARFEPVDRDALIKLSERQDAKRHGDADFLIAACKAIYAKDDDGHLIPLTEGQVPSGFDEATAEALGLEFTSARHLVYAMCSTDVAVSSLAQRVIEWTADTSQEVDGAVVGER